MTKGVVVDFNANLTRFSSGIDKATNDLKKFRSNAQRVSGNISAAFASLGVGLSVVGFASFVKGIIDAADNIRDLSQKVGISVRDLATWQLAAEQSGTSLESVARGVKGLAKNMVENGDAFKAAGITATDANGAMVQLADIFKGMPDGIEKTTLAVTLFGKSGMDMIPMLNEGSAGLAKSQANAAKYADALAKLAPKADEFNDKLKELEITGKAMQINAMLPMVDGLIGLTQWFKDATSGARGLGDALDFIGEKTNLEIFKLAGDGARVADRMLAPGRNPKTGWQIAAELEQDKKTLFLPGENSAEEKAATERGIRLRKALGGKTEGGTAGKQKRPFTGEEDTLFAIDEAVQKQRRAGFEETERATEKAADAIDNLREKYINLADPLQKYRVELAEIEQLHDAGNLNSDQRLEAMWKVNEAMDAEIGKMKELGDETKKTDNFARDIGLSFSSAFEDAVISGKSFSDTLKAIEQDIARIILRKTVTEPAGELISKGVDWASKAAGKWVSSFAGGGFTGTGARSGGVDGLGGFPAILHPNETVIDHTKGGGAAPVTVNLSYNIDSRTDMATIAMMMARTKQDTLAAIGNAQRRSG